MSQTTAENYVRDLITILLEQLNELEKEMTSCNPEDKEYLKGQVMGLYSTATLVLSQAEAFNIPVSEKSSLNLERYLSLE